MLRCGTTDLQINRSVSFQTRTALVLMMIVAAMHPQFAAGQQDTVSPVGPAKIFAEPAKEPQKSTARIISGQIESLVTPEQFRKEATRPKPDRVQRPPLDPLAVATRVHHHPYQHRQPPIQHARPKNAAVVHATYNQPTVQRQSSQTDLGKPIGNPANNLAPQFAQPNHLNNRDIRSAQYSRSVDNVQRRQLPERFRILSKVNIIL